MSLRERLLCGLRAFLEGDLEIEFEPESDEEPNPAKCMEFDPDAVFEIFRQLEKSEHDRRGLEQPYSYTVDDETMAAGMRIVELCRRQGFSEGQMASLTGSIWISVTDEELAIYGYKGAIN